MEIPINIINTAFQKLGQDTEMHPELEKELKAIAKYSSEDIVFKHDKKNLRLIDNNIRKLITDNQLQLQREVSIGLDELIQILACAVNQFNLAISKSEIKPVLIFLSINCYLEIDLAHYYEVAKSKRSKELESKIDQILSSVHFETKLENNDSFYETELLEIFKEGIKAEDIEKTYRLISAVERGGLGFHFNFLLESLIYFYFRLNSKAFATHLNTLKKPDQIVFYLQSFVLKDLITLYNVDVIDNKWVLFELIRQVIDEEKRTAEEFYQDEIETLLGAITQLLKVDRKFYFQCVRYFPRSKKFNIALGMHCCTLDEQDLLELFETSIPIDKYSFGMESRNLLFKEFDKTKNRKSFKRVSAIAHKKWTQLCNEIATDKEGFQNEILLSDLADFIVLHFSNQARKNLLNQFENCINHLRWIDSEWFHDESKQITKFNLYLSELYLLSYAIDLKKVGTIAIVESYQDLLDSQNINRFYSSHNLDPYEIILKNIANSSK